MTAIYEQPTLEAPLTPYAGTSGWSGSATSEQRARTADEDGTTLDRQRTVLGLLRLAGYEGMTWREIAEHTGWHHGMASGALSVLHKEGRIARLSESRQRCRVYVLPTYIASRSTEQQGRKQQTCPNCGHHL